jgi:hypothetical protein
MIVGSHRCAISLSQDWSGGTLLQKVIAACQVVFISPLVLLDSTVATKRLQERMAKSKGFRYKTEAGRPRFILLSVNSWTQISCQCFLAPVAVSSESCSWSRAQGLSALS